MGQRVERGGRGSWLSTEKCEQMALGAQLENLQKEGGLVGQDGVMWGTGERKEPRRVCKVCQM